MANLLNFGFFRTRTLTIEDEHAVPWGVSVEIDARYAPLVERLQAQADRAPKQYRRRVLLAAMLGYGFIALLLGLLAASAAAIVVLVVASGRIQALEIKLLLAVGMIAWPILRALWVRTSPPEGREVVAAEAPALFALIEEIRRKLDGPRLHKVLVTPDFNAAIVQHAQLGLLGGHRNYLILGLPLLQGLTEAETAAVIAHEYGHLAGSHGRFAAAIYRARTTWAQLSMNLRSGHAANLLRAFFRWYGPWFNAYSFVLARAQEYDADRASATVTDPQTASAALVRVTLQADRFSRVHWQEICEQADMKLAPGRLPYTSAGPFLQSLPPEDEQERMLRAALAATTDLRDTHPCLADRLRALGEPACVPAPLAGCSADRLLGPLADRIATELGERWWAEAKEGWADYHHRRVSEAEELAKLDARAASETLDAETQLRWAQLTEELRGGDAALPIYEALHASDPELYGVGYTVGRLRLAKGDRNGIAILEGAMQQAPNLMPYGCHEIIAFLERHGEPAAAASYVERLRSHEAHEALARQERNNLPPDTTFVSPAFTSDQLAWLRDRLGEVQGLKTVHMGLRTLQHSRDLQQIVFITLSRGAVAEATLDAVSNIFSAFGHVIVVTPGSDARWIGKCLEKLEQGLIFSRRG